MNVASATSLLQQLISIPSFSREEEQATDFLQNYLLKKGHLATRIHNNLIFKSVSDDLTKPHILLCSHIDTVAPNAHYTRDPYSADIQDGKLYGLGANDAGGALVSMIAVFDQLAATSQPFNLWLAVVAEEEISGVHGVSAILEHLPQISVAVVGEPTSLRMAVAEKGLLVVDGCATGIPGHAAHTNTLNPIYLVAKDVVRLKDFVFRKDSELLGPTRLTVSQIHAGKAHNQVPAECTFVLDIRVNEKYTNEEVFEILQTQTLSLLQARSLRLRSSGLNLQHPMIKTAAQLGIETYGSATLSDQALLPYDSIKIGPGDTLRSHTADEFIYLSEIEEGIATYRNILENYPPA